MHGVHEIGGSNPPFPTINLNPIPMCFCSRLNLKANYFVIPLVVIAVALLGGWFTGIGMPWYESEVVKPLLTPPKLAFPIAWNLIFVLCTASALIFWNKNFGIKKLIFGRSIEKHRKILMWIFGLNALLNVAWSLIFFVYHLSVLAFIEMLVLEATIIALIVLGWKFSKVAALLLVPYMLWLVLASYLTFGIIMLN